MTQQALAAQAVTLDDPTAPGAESEPLFYGLTAAAWLKISIVSLLMIATFRFNFYRLWLKTNPFNGEPNWRHSIVVPVVGLYYLYVNRDDLLRTPVYVAWSGLPILIFGILLFGYGIWPGQNDYLKDLGMVFSLFGVVALLCGWKMMKIAWFPIAFLICAIPWPELVYSYIASPLQHLAASVAVGTLRVAGVEAQNQGTKILMYGDKGWRALNVAEACAGLRSLMTFISVGAAVAFLSQRPFWQKVLITLSAIPIAIFCNVMRVTGQGFLHRWNEQWSEGFAHQFAGTVMLIPGFFFILLVGWILDKMFIEVADERQLKRRAPAAGTANVAVARPAPQAFAKPGAPLAAPKPAAAVAKAAPVAGPATITKPATPAKPPTNAAVPRTVVRTAPPAAPKPPSPAAKIVPPTIKPPAPMMNKPVAPKPAVPLAPPRPTNKEGM